MHYDRGQHGPRCSSHGIHPQSKTGIREGGSDEVEGGLPGEGFEFLDSKWLVLGDPTSPEEPNRSIRADQVEAVETVLCGGSRGPSSKRVASPRQRRTLAIIGTLSTSGTHAPCGPQRLLGMSHQGCFAHSQMCPRLRQHRDPQHRLELLRKRGYPNRRLLRRFRNLLLGVSRSGPGMVTLRRLRDNDT